MSETNRYCPLIRSECKDKSCMWYIPESEKCAVNNASQALEALVIVQEDLREIKRWGKY